MCITNKKLYIIAGPTGVGKTKYSIELAKKIGGSIISLDSVQVYKGLDIGSGKIKKDEMQGIEHFMIDVLEPTSSFNVKEFKDMANKCIEYIYNDKKIPILVGGTGFYINAILYDTEFQEEDEEKMQKVRDELYDEYKKNGIEKIYNRLKEVDPVSCDKIHINNIRRVIRAYEFYLLHNKPISKHNEEEKLKKSKYEYQFYVLNMDREKLYKRINDRVDIMINDGLIDEIRELQKKGVKKHMQSMRGIGYKELYDYVYENNCDKKILDDIVKNIKMHTRQYAKRQMTWFKAQKNIKYVEL